jgi:hypothetical protein
VCSKYCGEHSLINLLFTCHSMCYFITGYPALSYTSNAIETTGNADRSGDSNDHNKAKEAILIIIILMIATPKIIK